MNDLVAEIASHDPPRALATRELLRAIPQVEGSTSLSLRVLAVLLHHWTQRPTSLDGSAGCDWPVADLARVLYGRGAGGGGARRLTEALTDLAAAHFALTTERDGWSTTHISALVADVKVTQAAGPGRRGARVRVLFGTWLAGELQAGHFDQMAGPAVAQLTGSPLRLWMTFEAHTGRRLGAAEVLALPARPEDLALWGINAVRERDARRRLERAALELRNTDDRYREITVVPGDPAFVRVTRDARTLVEQLALTDA